MKVYNQKLVTPDDKLKDIQHGSHGFARLRVESTAIVAVQFWKDFGWLDGYEWAKKEQQDTKKDDKRANAV